MGRKRINDLLEQLKENQQKELENAAAIFTIAQVAVNELERQVVQEPPNLKTPLPALPAAPSLTDKAELLRLYGSYNGCRRAAKERGIKLKGSPTWKQLAAAFSYAEALKLLAKSYIESYPNSEIKGMTIEIKID